MAHPASPAGGSAVAGGAAAAIEQSDRPAASPSKRDRRSSSRRSSSSRPIVRATSVRVASAMTVSAGVTIASADRAKTDSAVRLGRPLLPILAEARDPRSEARSRSEARLPMTPAAARAPKSVAPKTTTTMR